MHPLATEEPDRAELLLSWDEELLRGGVMLSEWATFLIEDADVAFCAGANIAALLAAQAAMETHLRHEHGDCAEHVSFAGIIDRSALHETVKARLHEVRRYRNRWVHVNDPHDDERLLDHHDDARAELAEMATKSMRLLREVIYSVQWT